MMEPVAWRLRWIYPATGQATSWAATTDKLVADQKERDGLEVEPLVPASRLSDAEARINDLEAALDEKEIASGLTSDGNLWRYWAAKAKDLALKNAALERAIMGNRDVQA